MADPTPGVLDDVRELAALLRPAWAQISDGIPGWHPRCEGEDGGEGAGGGEGEGSEGGEGAGEPFDKDRALATIKKQREAEAAAKKRASELEAELKKYQDRDKTDQEKAAEKMADAEKRAATAEATALRLDVALDKAPEGMSIAQVRKLAKRLSGGTREELEADAEELFADFAPSEGDPPRRPRERLKPGAAPGAEPEETDPDKLAAMVPRRY